MAQSSQLGAFELGDAQLGEADDSIAPPPAVVTGADLGGAAFWWGSEWLRLLVVAKGGRG